MSLEQQLFTWDGWDGDEDTKIFYKCHLVRDIGTFKKGTLIHSIAIVETESKMEFYEEGGAEVLATFDLVLSVSE